ncbi:hypothetical protein F7725_001333 [Dissostichus mawsoni]|uniref:Uncharacterized protein n=1 Tax=Dissostichus mawsoni TaxID=36200 RepID=A0A7J5ZL36_DISMA|nr:hypothetical protein F7725_001333 [Dissostichus mawsoni]
MEDRHTARDGRKHLSNPQLDCAMYGGRVSSERTGSCGPGETERILQALKQESKTCGTAG